MTKIYIETYGCSLNQSDSELMAGLLKEKGFFEITEDIEEADVIILNSCIVKKPTENNFYNRLKELEKLYPYKKKIIAGCIPQADSSKIKKYPLIGTYQLSHIVEVVEETINDNVIHLIGKENEKRLELPKIRRNSVIGIVPILAGCLGKCSYCIVPKARGKLKSYPAEEIINEISEAVKDGCKEIWITSQDNGAYGKDINLNLIRLLKKIIELPYKFKLRIGMLNPNHVLKFLPELIEIYKDEKVFKFLHIPVQSGNNEILKLMNRKYKVEDFKEIIKQFRKEIPEITISTDIIAGFPTETEDQFKDSLNLIKVVRPDIVNISRFWPRKYTKAAKMKQIHGGITKDRSRVLTSIHQYISFENNKKWRNWQGIILIDEEGKDNTWIGRNYTYKPVIVKGDYKLGQEINVKVKDITSIDLRV